MKVLRHGVKKLLFSLLLISASIFLYQLIHTSSPKPKTPLQQGARITFPTNVMDIAKREINLSSPVLLLFFDPACPSCLEELLVWNRIYENRKLPVLGIGSGDNKTLERFASDSEIKFPIVPDPKRRLFNNFNIQHSPASIFFDNGSIVLADSNEFIGLRVKKIEEYLRGARK